MSADLGSLLLVTLLAALAPVAARWARPVRLPIVVGEIIAGVVIGKSGLDVLAASPALDFLSEFGFIYLMFLSGLEMKMGPEVRQGAEGKGWLGRPPVLAGVVFSLTLALAGAAGWALMSLGLAHSAVLMGLILSTTSLGMVVPVLREKGLSASPYGQTLLLAALVGDFATLLLLSLAFSFLGGHGNWVLAFAALLLAGFALAVHVGRKATRTPAINRLVRDLSHATAQIRVRGAFAVIVAWVFLAESLGVEMILGAFLAGALLSLISGPRDAQCREKLESFGYGFFIPIFFITVGADFDLAALTGSSQALLLAPALVALAYAVKFLPALALAPAFGWRGAAAGGVLLSARLSLIIAAASIAQDLGMVTPATHAALILVALVTCTISPAAFARLAPRAEEDERHGVLVVGGGELARYLGERLRRAGRRVTMLADDGQPQAQAPRDASGQRVVNGSPELAATLDQAGASRRAALAALSDDPAVNQRVCQLARREFGIPHVVTMTGDPAEAEEFEAMGVRVIRQHLAAALALEGTLLFPAAYDRLTDLDDDGLDMADAVVFNRAVAGGTLSQAGIPQGVLVLGVHREGEALVPNGDTTLQLGDVVTLVGRPGQLGEVRRRLESVRPGETPMR